MKNDLLMKQPYVGEDLKLIEKYTTDCEVGFSPKSSFIRTYLNRFELAFLLVIVVNFLFIITARAQTKTWTPQNNTTTDWDNTSNWLPSGSKPSATSDIVINVVGTGKKYPIVPSTGAICHTIKTMAGGTSIGSIGSGALTILASGTIGVTGPVTISCPLNLALGTTTTVNTTSSVTQLTLSGNITGEGSIILNGSTSGSLKLQPQAFANLVNLQISNGTIFLGSLITINGNINLSAGTLNIGAGTLVANGGITYGTGLFAGDRSSSLILSGNVGSEFIDFDQSSAELYNLTVDHTINTSSTLNHDIAIYGSIIFGSSLNTLNLNSKHVTLKSDAIGTAYIGEITGILLGASNVTVERYIDPNMDGVGKRAWRLLTIPVTGQTIREAWSGVAANKNAALYAEPASGSGTLITGHGFSNGDSAAAKGFDWFTGLGTGTTSSIRVFDTLTGWPSATNTPLTSLPSNYKQGYMLYVRGDRSIATSSAAGATTLRPTGTLRQGDITVPINERYSVVGNPYASPINLDLVYINGSNNTVITNNFWVWDLTLGSTGGYVAISSDGKGGYSNPDYLTVNSGQAFFVQKNEGGNIVISENNKTTVTGPVMLRPTNPTSGVSKLDIKLYQAVGATIGIQADGIVARYNNIYQESPNETFDAAKLYNFNENLSLVRNGRYLSIESRPYPTKQDTLYISFWGLKNRDYAFTINSSMFAGINQTAVLIDAFTSQQTVLNLNDDSVVYSFTVSSNVASSSLTRFKIVMTPVTVLPVTFTKIAAALLGTKVQVSWATAAESGVKNYTVERSADGTRFNKIGELAALNAAGSNSYQLMDNQPLAGNNYYRIRSNDADGKYAYSNIAALQLNDKKGMQVMPTVISNQRFTLSLNDQPAGNYQLIITNAAGQQVYQKMIDNIGGNNTRLIELASTRIPTGVYNLSVSGSNGNKQNFRLLINN